MSAPIQHNTLYHNALPHSGRPVTPYTDLLKKDFTGADTPGHPLAVEYLAFVNRYRRGYNAGITTYDLVIGPVARKKDSNGNWLMPELGGLPTQFKFEGWDGVRYLRPVLVMPPIHIGPDLA